MAVKRKQTKQDKIANLFKDDIKAWQGRKFKDTTYSPALGITQSYLSEFVRCRQSAWNTLHGWEWPAPKDALVFGSLFHSFLEDNYTLMREEGALWELEALLTPWIEKIGPTLNGDSKELILAMAEALYDPYFEYHQSDWKKDWVGIESKFAVEWEGYLLRGMIDGKFKLKKDLWLLETKTTSAISEDKLSNKLLFDFQNLFYITAAEALWGEKIKGVLYNVIRKPQLRIKKATKTQPAETFREFVLRMKDDVLSRPEWYFQRFEVPYTEKRKKQFRDELKWKLEDYTEWWENKGQGVVKTYKDESACDRGWTCAFLPACANNSMAGYLQTRQLFAELQDAA